MADGIDPVDWSSGSVAQYLQSIPVKDGWKTDGAAEWGYASLDAVAPTEGTTRVGQPGAGGGVED